MKTIASIISYCHQPVSRASHFLTPKKIRIPSPCAALLALLCHLTPNLPAQQEQGVLSLSYQANPASKALPGMSWRVPTLHCPAGDNGRGLSLSWHFWGARQDSPVGIQDILAPSIPFLRYHSDPQHCILSKYRFFLTCFSSYNVWKTSKPFFFKWKLIHLTLALAMSAGQLWSPCYQK